MRLTGQQSGRASFNHKRGVIRVFSAGSRRRLMQFMARLKTRKIRATFITLTFSEIVSNARAKMVFKRFAMRLRRKFEKASVVWRMELQERGAIHFHLLAFNLPFWKQKDLQDTWAECTEEYLSIADIRLIHGARSIMGYISKYIAKKDERTELTSLENASYQHASPEKVSGKYWGWINKDGLPLAIPRMGVLTDGETIRSISRWAWKKIGSDNPYNSISFSFFAENAYWLFNRAVEKGGRMMDEWEYTVKDHTRHKNMHDEWTDIFSEEELKLNPAPTIGRLVKGERSELVQPLIRRWLEPASRIIPLPVMAGE